MPKLDVRNPISDSVLVVRSQYRPDPRSVEMAREIFEGEPRQTDFHTLRVDELAFKIADGALVVLDLEGGLNSFQVKELIASFREKGAKIVLRDVYDRFGEDAPDATFARRDSYHGDPDGTLREEYENHINYSTGVVMLHSPGVHELLEAMKVAFAFARTFEVIDPVTEREAAQ